MAQRINFTPKEQGTKIDFTPKPVQIAFTPRIEVEPEQDEGFGIFNPLWEGPSRLGKSVASLMDEPALERSPFEARLRGFGAGVTEAVGDFLSEETSPFAITANLLGFSKPVRNFMGGAFRLGKNKLFGKAATEVTEKAVKSTPKGLTPEQHIDDIIDDIMARPDSDFLPGTAKLPQVIPETTIARENLIKALDDTKPLNKQQAEIYAREIREKVGKMTDVEATGVEGFRQRTSALAGKYERVEITPLSTKLTSKNLDELIDEIQNSAELLPLESRNAQEGLMRLYNGNVPRPSEIKLLRKVFGEEFDERLIKIAGEQGGILRKAGRGISGTNNLMRSLLTTFDFSAPGIQGRKLASYSEYWKAFPHMFRSWGSKRLFEAGEQIRKSHPYSQRVIVEGKAIRKSVFERMGIDFTDLSYRKEEKFRSLVAERLWLGVGRGVRMSNQAYIGFLNKLRMDIGVRLVKEAGPDILENDAVLKQIGNFINNATGRGNLGILEKHAGLIGELFFAGRLHAGKIRLWASVLDPKLYTQTNKVVRKATLRSLITSTTFGLALGELFRMGGAEVSNDPSSPDFRKIKIGNTRADPFGGDQPYAVAMAKLIMGKSTSSTSGRTTNIRGPFDVIPTIGDVDSPGGGPYDPTMGSTVLQFGANRLAPLYSMIMNLLLDLGYGDESFGVQSELLDKTVPIMAQDFLELMEEDPDLLPFMVPAIFGGVNIQTYGRQ